MLDDSKVVKHLLLESGRRFGLHSTYSYHTRARWFLASCMPLFHWILFFADSVVIQSIDWIPGLVFYLYESTSFCSSVEILLKQDLKCVKSLARPCSAMIPSIHIWGRFGSNMFCFEAPWEVGLQASDSRSKQTSSCPQHFYSPDVIRSLFLPFACPRHSKRQCRTCPISCILWMLLYCAL